MGAESSVACRDMPRLWPLRPPANHCSVEVAGLQQVGQPEREGHDAAGEHVDDALVASRAGRGSRARARCGRRLAVALPHVGSADHVDQAGLVLEVEEDHALRGRRLLAVRDHAGDVDDRAVGQLAQLLGGDDAPRRELGRARTRWGGAPPRGRSPRGRRRSPRPRACPGSMGASAPVTTPGSLSGRASRNAPAAHSASRRLWSKHANAPAVASASSASVGALVRRVKSARSVNGCSARARRRCGRAARRSDPRT